MVGLYIYIYNYFIKFNKILSLSVLLYVWFSTAGSPAYALYNIIGQKYQLYQNLNVWSCLGFGISTQLFGYGLAGLCRRYLVRPSAMLWPSNLSTIALLNSLHKPDTNTDRHPVSRFRFFWLLTSILCIYQFFPSYIAPILGAVSLLCYIPASRDGIQWTRVLGSARSGLGLLSFSFDVSLNFFKTIIAY